MSEKIDNSGRLERVHALLERQDTSAAARAAFHVAYPDAPPQMIEAAVFHVYVDGVGAALDWIAAAEDFLRNPREGLDPGATWHAVYHLYNWLQFQAVLPMGREGVLEQLKDLKQLVTEGDFYAADQIIQQLEGLFQGIVAPPNVE